jgi:hypothetical protein
MRESFAGDDVETEFLEEALLAGQGENALEAEATAFRQYGLHELGADAPPAIGFIDGQALDFGQVSPDQFQGGTADDAFPFAGPIHTDEEVAEVLVEIRVRAEQHPVELGMVGDEPVDVGDIGHPGASYQG